MLFFITGCLNGSEKEVHIIPDGYIGTVKIIYAQPNGIPEEYDSLRRRIYRIPFDGILNTQFIKNPGCFSLKDRIFYYVDSTDSTQLKQLEWFTRINPKYRDIKKSIVDYPDSICAWGIMLTSRGNVIDLKKGIFKQWDELTYSVDTLKNFKNNSFKY